MAEQETQTMSSPHLQALQNAYRGLKSGELTRQDLVDTLEYFTQALDKTVSDFQMLSRTPAENPRIAEQLPRVELAYQQHYDALGLMREFLETDNWALYDQAIEMVKGATLTLHEAFDVFQAVDLKTRQKPCVKCGHMNPIEANYCEKCQAKLMDTLAPGTQGALDFKESGGMPEVPQFIMTSNLRRIMDTCNGVLEGKVGNPEFEQMLNWMTGILRESHQEADGVIRKALSTIETGEVKEEEAEAMKETAAMLETGVSRFEEAMATMRRYLEDGNTAHVVDGFKLVLEGSVPLQAVMQIDQEVKKRLAERKKEE